eukprot:GILK01000302.1.p1 GENE.GILK01000302.1~~GILK01000302.1.p1  ORF type:complete len:562 (-),score=141.94 GILK01000302.1:1671-3356(-)
MAETLKAVPSLLSVETVVAVLKLIHSCDSSSSLNDPALLRFMLESSVAVLQDANGRLKDVQTSGSMVLATDAQATRCSIAPLIFHSLELLTANVVENKPKKVKQIKSLPQLCVDSIEQLFCFGVASSTPSFLSHISELIHSTFSELDAELDTYINNKQQAAEASKTNSNRPLDLTSTQRNQMSVHVGMIKIESVFVDLVSKGYQTEALSIVKVMDHLVDLLDEDEMKIHTEWFKNICYEDAITESPLIEASVQLHIRTSKTLTVLYSLCTDVRRFLGDIEEEDEETRYTPPTDTPKTPVSVYAILSSLNAVKSVITVVLGQCKQFFDEVESLLSRLNRLHPSDLFCNEDEVITESDLGSKIGKLEDDLYLLLTKQAKIIDELAQTALQETETHNLIKLLIQVYKTIGSLTKRLIPLKQSIPPRNFSKLVEYCAKSLTTNVYNLRSFKQGWSKDTKSTASKESKLVPLLIFNIENYERFLIKLSKATKVDFMRSVARSSAHDFKINYKKVAAAHKEEDEEQEGGRGGGRGKEEDEEEDAEDYIFLALPGLVLETALRFWLLI